MKEHMQKFLQYQQELTVPAAEEPPVVQATQIAVEAPTHNVIHLNPSSPTYIYMYKFLKKMGESIHQEHDGHYQMPLLFPGGAPNLPNNRALALHRIGKLRTQLKNNERYRQDYIAFMDDVIKKGYAEKVADDETLDADGSVWYIPITGCIIPRNWPRPALCSTAVWNTRVSP